MRLLALLLASLVLTGCGATSGPQAGPDTALPSAPRPAIPTPARDPSRAVTDHEPVTDRCLSDALAASKVTERLLTTEDRIELYGIEVGTGPRGLVLIHGSGSYALCQWADLLPVLARDGFRVLALDQRCQGWSGCAADGRGGLDRDVVAGVAALRHDGARHVTVMGESRGGAVALGAAARPDSRIDAVVALSAVWYPDAYSGPRPARPDRLVARIRVPVLFVSSRDDGLVDQPTYRRWAAAARDATYIVYTHRGHGVVMLSGPGSPYRRDVLPFLAGG